MVVPAAVIGIVCGLCAILFTIINLKARPVASASACCLVARCCFSSFLMDTDITLALLVMQVTRARSEFFKGRPARWRMAEPCLLIVIFVTLGMVMPLFFPCTETQASLCLGFSWGDLVMG